MPTTPIGPTIEEDEDGSPGPTTSTAPTPTPAAPARLSTARQSQRSSQQRSTRNSEDMRWSMQTIKLVESSGTDSNRSSRTIKATPTNGSGTATPNNGWNDDEFEKALRHFANERDTFLTELSVSAGVVTKPKARPRTQRITGDDAATLRSGIGSIRRRISMRDMSSVRRQQSTVARNRKLTQLEFGDCWLTDCGSFRADVATHEQL